MYKYINADTIEPFQSSHIKDEATDTMYVHPSKETLSRLGYMELVRPTLPELAENQYIKETYSVAEGKIRAVYTVCDLPEAEWV